MALFLQLINSLIIWLVSYFEMTSLGTCVKLLGYAIID